MTRQYQGPCDPSKLPRIHSPSSTLLPPTESSMQWRRQLRPNQFQAVSPFVLREYHDMKTGSPCQCHREPVLELKRGVRPAF